MANILVLAGCFLLVLGAFCLGFVVDKSKTRLWLALTGLGLAAIVISIIVFSIGLIPQETTAEPESSLPLISSGLL